MDEPSFPRFKTISQALGIHGCRWGWCRLTFASNDELNRHVVYEHVRNAKPVRMRDLSMLVRAQEGIGESLSLPEMTSADTHTEDGHTQPSQKSSHQLAPPSSPERPSQGRGSPKFKEQSTAQRTVPALPCLAPRPNVPITPKRQFGDIYPLPPRALNSRSVSSPMESPDIASLTASPVFDSLVDSAARGRPLIIPHTPTRTIANRGQLDTPLQYSLQTNSSQVQLNESPQSSSASSRANVESQLTQDIDVADDFYGTGAVGEEVHGHRHHDHAQSPPKGITSASGSLPPAHGQSEIELFSPTDVQRPARPTSGGLLPDPQPDAGSQFQNPSELELPSRENAQRPALLTQAKGYSWSAQSVGWNSSHSSHPNVNISASQGQNSQYQLTKAANGMGSTELHSPNHSQNSLLTGQDHLSVFRSGSMKIGSRPSYVVNTSPVSASSMDFSPTKPQRMSRSHSARFPPLSNSQSQDSIAHGNPLSYPLQLQTQAPYRSQSSSQ